ncbi:MAG: hypothetical protein CM15mP15_0100 [Prochlorococcus sp.]|nr:MAG: hypothetical protein CM15mP15_0100 [Prochlorococcus sp.]
MVLNAIKEISDSDTQNCNFEDDDDDEPKIEEVSLYLASEMMESKPQKAAGSLLIYSRIKNLSDIHIEPIQDEYKIRVRKMESCISLCPYLEKWSNTVACLKIYDDGYCWRGGLVKMGKSLENLACGMIEFNLSSFPVEHGEKLIIFVMSKGNF